MSLGPVQVLVIGTSAEPDGSVLAELDRLAEAGIVRLLDLVVVSRTDEGALDTLPTPAGLHPGIGDIAEEFLAGPGEYTPDVGGGGGGYTPDAGGGPGGARASSGDEGDVAEGRDEDATWSLLDSVAVGGTAVIALIEHVWAGPLKAALETAGAHPLGESWLGPEDLADLEAIVARHTQPAI